MLPQLSAVIAAFLLFFAAASPVLVKARAMSIAETGKALPNSLGEWRAMPFTEEGIGIEQFRFNHTLSRTYQNQFGERIVLEIGYVANQSGWRSVVPQTKLLEQGEGAHSVISVEGPVRFNQFIRENDSRRKLSLFWYQVRGRVVVEPLWARVFATWGAITEGRSDGIFVVVTRGFDPGKSEAVLQAQSAELFRIVWPYIKDGFNAT